MVFGVSCFMVYIGGGYCFNCIFVGSWVWVIWKSCFTICLGVLMHFRVCVYLVRVYLGILFHCCLGILVSGCV